MKKRFVALVLAMICILMFSGCSSDELSLISALYKDAKMTSVKTTEVLSGNMKITLPQEIIDDMEDYDLNPQSILNMLSSFRLEATSEQQLNGNTATGKYSYAVISEDLNFSGEIYASIDDNHTKTIVKIPTPLKALLPHKYENAIYCTVDTADITDVIKKQQEYDRVFAQYYEEEYIETEIPQWNPKTSLSQAMQFNDGTFQFIKNYASLMKDTPNLVTKSGKTYTLKITDQDFKALLGALVLTYFDSPEAREEINVMWDTIRTYFGSIYPPEMMETFPELPQLPDNPTTVSDMRLQAELMLALFDGVRIIGEDGICVTYQTNSNGYITEMDVNVHLDFDINAITELLTGSADYEDDFAFEIRICYNQKRQHINSIQKISLPTLTEENNLPIYRLFVDSIQSDIDYYQKKLDNGETYQSYYESEEPLQLPASDGSISIVYDSGYRLKLLPFGDSAPVINENGTLYVPLEALMNWLNVGYTWDPEAKMICFRHPKTYQWVKYRPGDRVMICDDYEMTLSAPTLFKDGQDYLPLRAFISATTNYRVQWNQTENAAYIMPWHVYEEKVQ